jgi:hypothetical protein
MGRFFAFNAKIVLKTGMLFLQHVLKTGMLALHAEFSTIVLWKSSLKTGMFKD